MKKNLIFILTIIFILVSCASQKKIEAPVKKAAVSNAGDEKSLPVKRNTCTVFNGEEYSVEEQVYNMEGFSVISLVGNGSTGYSWEYSFSEEGFLKVDNDGFYHGRLYDRGEIEEILPDGTKISYRMPEIVGAGTTYFWKLTPEKPFTDKTITMAFDYRRRWESVPPVRHLEYLITLKKDGSINCDLKSVNTVPRG